MEQTLQYIGHEVEDIRKIELQRLIKQVSWVYPKLKIEPVSDYTAVTFDPDLVLQAIHDKNQEYSDLTQLEQLEETASSWALQMLTPYISKNKLPILASKSISDIIDTSFLENSDKVDFASVHSYALLLPDGTITQKNVVLMYSIQRNGDEETVDDVVVSVKTITSNRTGKTTYKQSDEEMKTDEMPIVEALQSLLTPVILA